LSELLAGLLAMRESVVTHAARSVSESRAASARSIAANPEMMRATPGSDG
jgi:hypothetical protein